jgi:hypothetical protein
MSVLIHILGDGAAAHDADLVSGEFIAGIADHCSDAAAALVNNPSETRNPNVRLAVYYASIAWFWFGGD